MGTAVALEIMKWSTSRIRRNCRPREPTSRRLKQLQKAATIGDVDGRFEPRVEICKEDGYTPDKATMHGFATAERRSRSNQDVRARP